MKLSRQIWVSVTSLSDVLCRRGGPKAEKHNTWVAVPEVNSGCHNPDTILIIHHISMIWYFRFKFLI